MANIKLQHKLTGSIIEKTELAWKHLPNDRKAQYNVVDEGTTAIPGKHFSPPELEKKEAPKADVKKEDSAIAPSAETQEQQIIRLDGEGKTASEIGKVVGAHFKTVEKILKAAKK